MMATETKFTAGPWQSQHDNSVNGVCAIIGNVDGDDGHITFTNVCDLDEQPDEWLANRALICAAPDLFYALSILADRMEGLGGWITINEVDRAALKRARDVLAKANPATLPAEPVSE